jgi:hypothetical protein
MSSNYYSSIKLDIRNNLSNDKPFYIVKDFFKDCMSEFNEQNMIRHFTKSSSHIFNPDSKRLLYNLSAEDLQKKKYNMFTKMHTKVIALTEEMDKRLIVSSPGIVVNLPKVLEQYPHHDYNKDKNPLDSRNSYSFFGVICTSTKLIAWINGTFTHLLY